MSNLKSAKHAIEAELEHAKQGVAFYQSRVEALEDALAKLNIVDTPSRDIIKPAVNGQTKMSGKPGRGRKPRAKAEGGDDKLPSTGKDFWPDLISAQPQSASEIFDAALKTLGITPTKDQSKKLAQRQANALSILTKKGIVSSSGSGRSRRFFK
jgi:hypothetical protein